MMPARKRPRDVRQPKTVEGTNTRRLAWRAALAVLGATAILAPQAMATDAPHDLSRLTNGCEDCHKLHNAPGLTLTNQSGNANLCMSCHSVNGFNWNGSDQAVPGTSGSSHSWSGNATNSSMGAAPPTSTQMAIRLSNGTDLMCSTCHEQHKQTLAPFDPLSPAAADASGRHFMRVANDTNQMCEDCHSARVMTSVKTHTGSALSHPIGQAMPSSSAYHLPPQDVGGAGQVAALGGTASGGSTTSLVDATQAWSGLTGQFVRFTSGANKNTVRQITSHTGTQLNFSSVTTPITSGVTYEIDADGNSSNNVVLDNSGSPSFTAGKVRCLSCHGVHYADSDSTTYDDQPRTGDGYLLRRTNNNDTCVGCHSVAMHSSATTSTKYGTWGASFTCQTCHQPHGTNNIYLVRSTIATPNSGNKTVDFRNRNGTADYSHVTVTNPGNGICEVCHTKTSNSDNSPRFRNTGEGDGGQHYSGACTDCHLHSEGFKGSESQGNVSCEGCHPTGMLVADTARTATYHHVMEAADQLTSGVTTYPTAAAPTTSTSDLDKTCVQCHADHNVFRPDKNTSNSLGRGANLRSRIGSPPPTGTPTVTAAPGDSSPGWYSNRDYDAGFGAQGLCISCHTQQQTKNNTDQKNAGTTVTPAISPTSFGASAHTYAVGGQFSNGNSTFTVDCVKCHNSDTTPNKQNGTYKFQLHTSVDRSLRAPLGMTTPTDAMEEKFCYRCHHKTSDTNPGGGAAKSVSGKDWYNVANMTAGAEGIYSVIHTGNGAAASTCSDGTCDAGETPAFCPSDCPPTCGDGTCEGDETNASCPADCPVTNVTTDTLYFKPVTEEAATEPMPNAHEANENWEGGTWIGRVMSPNAPTVNYETKTQNITRSSSRQWRMVTFCTPTIATSKTLSSGTWNFYVYGRESNSSANAYFGYELYRWRSDDSNGGTIISARTGGSELSTNSEPGSVRNWSYGGSSRSFSAGDRICIDLYLDTNSGSSSYNASMFWGNGAAGRVVMPTTMTFGSGGGAAGAYCGDGTCGTGETTSNCSLDCTGGGSSGSYHDVEKYSGKHKANPTDENRAYISANKHVECSDCHNPHASASGMHTAGTNNVSGVLSGVSGAVPTWGTTNWSTPTGWTQTTATKEYQICFKCHSSFNTNLAGWDSNWTDVAQDFNPSNQSYHPVVSALPATDPGNNGSSRLQSTQLTNGWAPGMTMYCSDCHGNAATSPASQGPHGSAVAYMLKGPNTNWPNDSTGQLATRNSMTGVFCNNCHPTGNNIHQGHSRSDHRSAACIRCHILVPHGGKLSRLIGDKDSMPARLAYQGNLTNNWITSFTKRATNSYSKSDCGSDNGACSDHGGVNASENW